MFYFSYVFSDVGSSSGIVQPNILNDFVNCSKMNGKLKAVILQLYQYSFWCFTINSYVIEHKMVNINRKKFLFKGKLIEERNLTNKERSRSL